MSKSMFPSLMKSLVKPTTKKIKNGIHLCMSTDMHSKGHHSIEFMGFTEGDVDFLLNSINALEEIIFYTGRETNWIDAAYSIQKILPKNTDNIPVFKQFCAYLNESIASNDKENTKLIIQEFTETILMMDSDDKHQHYLLPDEIIAIDMPSGQRKKRYF